MPTKREREYYRMGFEDGQIMQRARSKIPPRETERDTIAIDFGQGSPIMAKRKRKLSPWNKFVKANSKKPRFIYKSGSNKGKLNLKKMGVAFRKTPAGKKKK